MTDKPAIIHGALKKDMPQGFVNYIRKDSTNGTEEKSTLIVGPNRYHNADDTSDEEMAEEKHGLMYMIMWRERRKR